MLLLIEYYCGYRSRNDELTAPPPPPPPPPPPLPKCLRVVLYERDRLEARIV